MRQIGDRLIPVGVTSGRVHPLGQEESSSDSSENGGSRRRRRQHGHGFEQFFGMSGQDLEELMMMEAMRLSLLEHEEQQRKAAAEKKKLEETEAAAAASNAEAVSPAGPGPSTMAARSNLSTHDSSESSSGTSISPSSSEPSSMTHSIPLNRETSSQCINPTSTDTNAIISTGGSSWHLHRASPPLSSTSSTASAILTNENPPPNTSGPTKGEQPPAHDEPNRQFADLGISTKNDPAASGSSVSLGTPNDNPTYDFLPSSPDSPAGLEPLFHRSMDSRVLRKIGQPSEDLPS
jgi:hypothetical protein